MSGLVVLEERRFTSESVSGHVRLLLARLPAPLASPREIWLYLPPSYDGGERRYPVLYMHDGQNLFDEASSYAGAWGVDEAAETLATAGLEVIVVGVANPEAERLNEYSPFVDEDHGGGRGDRYLDFLVYTLKPFVDRRYRSLPDARFTAMAGSSMGGLISLYGALRYPATFGFVGALSPAFWFADFAILDFIERHPAVPGLRVYLDTGTEEGGDDPEESRRYLTGVRAVGRLLRAQGAEVAYLEAQGATHDEAAWRARFPSVLEWFLRGESAAVFVETKGH